MADILIKNVSLNQLQGHSVPYYVHPHGQVFYEDGKGHWVETAAIELPSYIELKNMFNARCDYFKTEGFNYPEREAFDQILCDLKIAPTVLEANNG